MRQRMILGTFCFVSLLVACVLSLLNSRHLMSLIQINEAILKQRVQKRTEEIETLQNLGTQLTACQSIEEALEVIKLSTSILLPRFTGRLALFKPSRDSLEFVESWNGDQLSHKLYSPEECWALRSGKPYIGDIRIGNIVCSHQKKKDKQTLCIPLTAQGETHGVLHFSSKYDLSWTPEEHQLASAVSEHVSMTLANLDLRDSLRQQAIRDPLTGLYNRRYLLETMEHEISRSSRKKSEMGLMMIDLDYFKKFNDTYGHDIGDFILAEFGRLIQLIIREEDIACRYGGEEFTLMLPETGKNDTLKVAEKIRNHIQAHKFYFNNKSYAPITLSIGIAVFPHDGKTTSTLLKQADEALYQAKDQGRNQVVTLLTS